MAYGNKASKSILKENPADTFLMNSQVYKDSAV
jgi:hypothetical protein